MGSNHRLVLFTHALCRLSYPPSLRGTRPQSATVSDFESVQNCTLLLVQLRWPKSNRPLRNSRPATKGKRGQYPPFERSVNLVCHIAHLPKDLFA
jgi:hypothetical protein